MKQATWIPCDPPSDTVLEELTQICRHMASDDNDFLGAKDYFLHLEKRVMLSHFHAQGGVPGGEWYIWWYDEEDNSNV